MQDLSCHSVHSGIFISINDKCDTALEIVLFYLLNHSLLILDSGIWLLDAGLLFQEHVLSVQITLCQRVMIVRPFVAACHSKRKWLIGKAQMTCGCNLWCCIIYRGCAAHLRVVKQKSGEPGTEHLLGARTYC